MRRLHPRAAKMIALAARGAITSNNLSRQVVSRPLNFKSMDLPFIWRRITELGLNSKILELILILTD